MPGNAPNDFDLYLFHEGNHFHIYRVLGAHPCQENGISGVRFSLWAPNAREVRLVGNFNNWQGHSHSMSKTQDSGIWSIFISGLGEGSLYKYEIYACDGEVLLKSDPFAVYSEKRPETASIVYSLQGYEWQDQQWQNRKSEPIYDRPMSIFEVHLGSWKIKEDGDFYTYRELAQELVDYVADMGFTHVELMPLAEHPYDGSWGYQATGYYSVTSRYGTPHDFMYFVDCCHQKGIGVILDWVPGHFCRDAHGLRRFDGSALFEYQDFLKGENFQWGTMNFDLGRPEVQSFLISNAIFWMEIFHIDGLRVDAVASMLYLDHAKELDQWTANQYGGRENLEAISFLRKLNEAVFRYFPHALMMAEESSDWPLVSAPTYLGGLGFNFKWNMGWMNDTLKYMELDSMNRKWHHDLLTFSFWYAFSENFILPLSHDEVVHLKNSLLQKMPGDYWQKFANLRLLYGYMMAHPGKKLLFMGGDIGQFIEWRYGTGLDWNILAYDMHRNLNLFLKDLNWFYRRENTLWENDYNQEGFEWIDPHDYSQSIISFIRKGKNKRDFMVIICNLTPKVYENYRVGVPEEGEYEEIFSSDLGIYGGTGQWVNENMNSMKQPYHNKPFSLEIKIPPLAVVFIKLRR
ncbi:1,4-alpha-glucan branching protein GlgB [Candidatus Contubernalis alkaliaceticus]|uniref:1,4-alpha-glucan branching protein GlgB n=1 Tax=Candidatus Contubernalis alkaliaceticus TaxID=338645 RepID=UPI001F4BD770|nr:1,4-alpha-glucan branching protein GlgB [Candidatus Contubernalis alkalaceticus]UNC92695.1 1,4-alpha-glucan branching protein GlgB [Candidatus Contubernalis alkalaceticus]